LGNNERRSIMTDRPHYSGSTAAVLDEVEFPTRCTGVVGTTWAVHVASFLPDGERPVTSTAFILGDAIAIENILTFNRGLQDVLLVRALELGSSKVIVVQAGQDGRIASATMYVDVASIHCPPSLGSFGKGRFCNIKIGRRD
jgi:hypothetical protein